ncbi:MAG: hypothetical protein E6H02_00520 [Bacillati bacterium ANGP1]|uniref:Uncharacterized protein n=1 Tax=Candidatus Segetimicrobium genomatis TaxID=2569760 RepID=A0A537M8T5_9BACT|nr:MAG: hypothetical protein E6H02_00520 [Terrabacteria group bacterium ANGP1]
MRLDLLTDINRDYAVVMNYPAVDRFLVKILWWHLGFTILMAVANSSLRLSERFPSPFSWRVLSGQKALGATLIGIAAAAIPALVRGLPANHYAWRVMVSAALTVYSYLFVFMSGGAIEMHFHFFMVMALLTVYSDWRLGWVVLRTQRPLGRRARPSRHRDRDFHLAALQQPTALARHSGGADDPAAQGQGRSGSGLPGQERVPLARESRIADPHECHPGLRPTAGDGLADPGTTPEREPNPPGRTPPPRTDQ